LMVLADLRGEPVVQHNGQDSEAQKRQPARECGAVAGLDVIEHRAKAEDHQEHAERGPDRELRLLGNVVRLVGAVGRFVCVICHVASLPVQGLADRVCPLDTKFAVTSNRVYDSVSLLMSSGRAGSIKKNSGISMDSPASSRCWVKQKHSVLCR